MYKSLEKLHWIPSFLSVNTKTHQVTSVNSITVRQIQPAAKIYLTTVESIVSILGIHEYNGHCVNKYGDHSNNHSLVYEAQIEDATWFYLTSDCKRLIFMQYEKCCKNEGRTPKYIEK